MTSPLHPAVEDVIRIPVAGPQPFNTLAYVRFAATPLANQYVPLEPGDVGRRTTTSPSPLVVSGFNPKDARQRRVEHSTTAVLTSLAASDDNTFTTAVDSIDPDAQVDQTGRVLYTWHWASRFGELFWGPFPTSGWLNFIVTISSWVLLYEPHEIPVSTAREREIVRHLEAALSNREIVSRLPATNSAV